MKKFLRSRDGTSKGAALIIVLAFVVLVTVLSLTYFSRTTTDRQLAQSSYNDTASDLLARSALDITVSDLKQEIVDNPTVTAANIQPARYPAGIPNDNPNLIRYSSRNAAASRASTVSSTAPSANGRSISLARWNSHYLIPPANATGSDSTPVAGFTAPDWVLVTSQGPNTAPPPNAVIGRYGFAVYDEGGLIDVNIGGFPTYASLSPTRPTRKWRPRYPSEESEIILVSGPPPCQKPKFTPNHFNNSIDSGAPFSLTLNTSGTMPQTFDASFLPHGLSLNPSTGTISGTPTSPGAFTITLTATNECGNDTATWNLTIEGRIAPDSTPWPANLARKGTVAFADLTTLPSTPTAITPTTPVSFMEGFPSTTQIGKIMGWRNYATTRQTGASFNNPSFPLGSADSFAENFLGAAYPLATSFTTVSTAVRNNRTDQAAMSRQELIKLQRTIGFSQSLLQYLGTFSRELNRPAPDWPQVDGHYLTERFDMTNLQVVIPGYRVHRGNGKGHQYGLNKKSQLGRLFGLIWKEGTWVPGTRFTDPNYYGHWEYNLPGHNINDLPANPDFFQIINYAMNRVNGGASNPQKTFQVGAALIDQYDVDDLYDADPNLPNNSPGNTITIIDTVGNGNPADFVYGIEGMSYDDPVQNSARPPLAPFPPPALANYVLLNRRFENVGEFAYTYNPASTLASKTLDFFTAASTDKPMLDFFTYNTASPRAGMVNLNTRNGVVLASIIKGALLNDPGAENTPTALVSQTDALTAAQAIVQETTSTVAGHGPALTRADVARLAAVAVAAVPNLATSDETKNTIARALADTGQARTWNLMIDVIAQTGQYTPGTPDLTDPAKFIVQGEKRYWLHIAVDRDNGSVLGTQLEEVVE
jgi:Putative Ig domain